MTQEEYRALRREADRKLESMRKEKKYAHPLGI